MTKFVIGPEVALRLAQHGVAISTDHELLAPTLIRSQLLSLLYQQVQRERMTDQEAAGVLDRVRGMRIRLLGDRVLQRVAWQVAEQLGLKDTYDAEYIALTQLHADAFITLDDRLAEVARARVRTASVDALT
ncbi:MAG: type II toxin-antitoxin system VapC family toxin [Nocardioides sp.]